MLGLKNMIEPEIFEGSKLEISKIVANPNQPRKEFDEKTIDELANSIKLHGQVQAIVVTPQENGMYMIVAGERRYRAMKKLGYEKVTVNIKDYSADKIKEIALVENIQREQLNPIEEAEAYKSLKDG